jgi:hypothetical protein
MMHDPISHIHSYHDGREDASKLFVGVAWLEMIHLAHVPPTPRPYGHLINVTSLRA